ncbi:uncharacterized protein [Rutidosis leptorrhynchoides]|uniref:uncharacterized protein n=1 Tax=Rutidosis leptorrhynchoides TaxID=125765 RepID=UPI003A997EC5
MSIMPICAAVNVKAAGQETSDDADNMEIINPAYPEQKIKVGRNISADTRKQIIQLLVQCMDVFAWSENDMTGIPRHIAEHRLNVKPALKPIVQKRRGMAPDRVKWLCEEVAKLVRAGILREVQYQSWIANPVLVKKPDERNFEAYVDDLVIKSTTQERIIEDMREKFDTLRKINMKLNPLKCSFSETEGKFLGYLVTEQEISGRLALWVVELGAYQISYLPRSSVKGQVMGDYLAEMSGELEVINERTALKPILDETWDLFTDGALCAEGAGAGLVLANLSGEEHTYALRFNFDVSNNEAEYEALLAGLNIARKMNIAKLRAITDSHLVANQFNGSFEAHDPSMQKYLQLLKELAERFEHFKLARFEHFKLAQVPRSQNKKVDALSKLAALTFSHFQKQVWVEELPSKSIDSDLMVASVEEEQPNWMEPIIQYICNDALPSDSREARLVRERAPMYIIQNDILYRKSYCGPMMRCVGPIEAEMSVEEVHNGTCALHSGYKTIAAKIMRMGYFWPSLYRDAQKLLKDSKVAKGPFPAGPGNVKFLIVAIDYFTKWVEAKAVRTITGVQMRNFSTRETPFSLVYGSEAVISAEILVPTHIIVNFKEEANDAALSENLNFIEERRLMATIREANNK